LLDEILADIQALTESVQGLPPFDDPEKNLFKDDIPGETAADMIARARLLRAEVRRLLLWRATSKIPDETLSDMIFLLLSHMPPVSDSAPIRALVTHALTNAILADGDPAQSLGTGTVIGKLLTNDAKKWQDMSEWINVVFGVADRNDLLPAVFSSIANDFATEDDLINFLNKVDWLPDINQRTQAEAANDVRQFVQLKIFVLGQLIPPDDMPRITQEPPAPLRNVWTWFTQVLVVLWTRVVIPGFFPDPTSAIRLQIEASAAPQGTWTLADFGAIPNPIIPPAGVPTFDAVRWADEVRNMTTWRQIIESFQNLFRPAALQPPLVPPSPAPPPGQAPPPSPAPAPLPSPPSPGTSPGGSPVPSPRFPLPAPITPETPLAERLLAEQDVLMAPAVARSQQVAEAIYALQQVPPQVQADLHTRFEASGVYDLSLARHWLHIYAPTWTDDEWTQAMRASTRDFELAVAEQAEEVADAAQRHAPDDGTFGWARWPALSDRAQTRRGALVALAILAAAPDAPRPLQWPDDVPRPLRIALLEHAATSDIDLVTRTLQPPEVYAVDAGLWQDMYTRFVPRVMRRALEPHLSTAAHVRLRVIRGVVRMVEEMLLTLFASFFANTAARRGPQDPAAIPRVLSVVSGAYHRTLFMARQAGGWRALDLRLPILYTALPDRYPRRTSAQTVLMDMLAWPQDAADGTHTLRAADYAVLAEAAAAVDDRARAS
jgi:hypothetical protein